MDESDIKKTILSTSADEKRIYRTRIQKFKKSHFLYVVLLMFLASLQFIAIAFFSRGFLLSRHVLDNISKADSQLTLQSSPKFDRAVVLIVDALRFDFVIPIEKEKANSNYHNNINIMYDKFMDNSESCSSLLLKFMADPPTTTLQRLKGLTTGSLPTFIDAGSNFNGDTIEEDNLIKQLYLHDKNVLFVGDDTWDALFNPFLSNNSAPFESLNVWDLDTVDNGVISFFNDHIHSKEWDVLVGHMLGVDHVGHKYGPDHFTMKEKQTQVNEFIHYVMQSLDDDTLLVVMGDHGMDRTGNHGGDSIDELESTLFLYSKTPGKFGAMTDGNQSIYNISDYGSSYRSVNQIDLVSTLSLMLGTPIPFNNLGWPIEEMFNTPEEGKRMTQITMDQLLEYKKTMNLQFPLDRHDRMESILDEILEHKNPASGHEYERQFLEMCKDLWARFDYYSITTGVILMFISLVLLISITKLIPSIVVNQMVPEFAPWICTMSVISNICFFAIYYVFQKPPLIDGVLWCFLFATAIGIIIGCCIPIFDRYSLGWVFVKLREDSFSDYWSCIGCGILIIHACLFTSNSFTIWEDRIVTFLLTSLGMLTLFEFAFLPKRQSTNALLTAKINENEGTTSGVNSSTANSNSLPLSRFARLLGGYHSIVLIICTRLASLITICREEQGDSCTPTFTTSSNSSWWCMMLCFLIIFLIPSCIKGYYNLTSSYQAAAPIWIDVFLKGSLFLNFIYWSLNSLENSDNSFLSDYKYDFTIAKFTLARMLAGVTIIATNIGWLMGPLCIKLNVHNTDVKSHQATILGYMNIYGSEYFLLVINVLMSIILFNKPLAQVSISLMCNQLLSILEIVDLLKLKENVIGPIVLGLLSYQQFFSTGHQATIPSVQWDVAFILSEKITFPITHLSVILNTFGPHIIVALSVALITLWKQPPDVLKPQTLLGRIVSNCGVLLTYNTLLCLSSFVWVTFFRRHLMVWKIFCPRFMFAALCLIVTQLVVTFGTIAFATGRLIQHINDIFWQ
ncbi:mannose-ethanolamine phosphotransferase GPI13 KNAG_0J02820 [Huiozyma naganishii CBS 8797]|uniref:Uncharacterized protein n=1 Tax=Huiozyma naganishii (strain ATCC MYA-139 / BCRC 22969 / CBS 8797 / KCTC 17520 / NBRC 10181 / NCYC 3082 / Yp74L-3) TaxID=1071383 RepID=J7SAP7_HUIN7|nr:hypothetical protein KNAG_0J02820 [Kazachstania naganishii CBS 8797]CCK72361.1 hypothetical protein KNAG_0J02820 [Kazachstania naganishii CBS 8797]